MQVLHPLTRSLTTNNTDLYNDLRQRFPRLRLPGILLNGTIWVHGDDTRELQATWGKAWFDHVLHAADTDEEEDDDKEHDDIVEEEEEEEEASLHYVPAPLQSSTTTQQPQQQQQQQVLNQSMRSNASSKTSSLYTSPSTASSQLASVKLPNGTHVEMGALIRLLMRGTFVWLLVVVVFV